MQLRQPTVGSESSPSPGQDARRAMSEKAVRSWPELGTIGVRSWAGPGCCAAWRSPLLLSWRARGQWASPNSATLRLPAKDPPPPCHPTTRTQPSSRRQSLGAPASRTGPGGGSPSRARTPRADRPTIPLAPRPRRAPPPRAHPRTRRIRPPRRKLRAAHRASQPATAPIWSRTSIACWIPSRVTPEGTCCCSSARVDQEQAGQCWASAAPANMQYLAWPNLMGQGRARLALPTVRRRPPAEYPSAWTNLRESPGLHTRRRDSTLGPAGLAVSDSGLDDPLERRWSGRFGTSGDPAGDPDCG